MRSSRVGSISARMRHEIVGTDERYVYDVEIRVRPEARIVAESLSRPGPAARSGAISQRDLIVANADDHHAQPGITVQIDNGKRGVNPSRMLRDTRLVLPQVALMLGGSNRVERSLLRAIDAVLSALRGVFELDPVRSATHRTGHRLGA